jgi:hypothetical protein
MLEWFAMYLWSSEFIAFNFRYFMVFWTHDNNWTVASIQVFRVDLDQKNDAFQIYINWNGHILACISHCCCKVYMH